MKKYLCTFELPELLDHSFWELIPKHRSYINELMRTETILTYAVNQQRSTGWVVLNANSKREAVAFIEKFPIRSYIFYQIDELFIFDSMIGTPKLILN